MRMGPDAGMTAADVVNGYEADVLRKIRGVVAEHRGFDLIGPGIRVDVLDAVARAAHRAVRGHVDVHVTAAGVAKGAGGVGDVVDGHGGVGSLDGFVGAVGLAPHGRR